MAPRFRLIRHRLISPLTSHREESNLTQSAGSFWQSLPYWIEINFLQAKLMATMNVSLPDPMKDWVESQVKSGKYANSSDYVRDLIRQDQVVQEKRHALIQALIDGEESGSAGKLDMDEIKRKARQRAGLSSPNA